MTRKLNFRTQPYLSVLLNSYTFMKCYMLILKQPGWPYSGKSSLLSQTKDHSDQSHPIFAVYIPFRQVPKLSQTIDNSDQSHPIFAVIFDSGKYPRCSQSDSLFRLWSVSLWSHVSTQHLSCACFLRT